MLNWFDLDDPAGRKRALTALVTFLTLTFINPVLAKLGLPAADPSAIVSAALVVATYLHQSGKNSEADKALEAAKVTAQAAQAPAPAPSAAPVAGGAQ